MCSPSSRMRLLFVSRVDLLAWKRRDDRDVGRQETIFIRTVQYITSQKEARWFSVLVSLMVGLRGCCSVNIGAF